MLSHSTENYVFWLHHLKFCSSSPFVRQTLIFLHSFYLMFIQEKKRNGMNINKVITVNKLKKYLLKIKIPSHFCYYLGRKWTKTRKITPSTQAKWKFSTLLTELIEWPPAVFVKHSGIEPGPLDFFQKKAFLLAKTLTLNWRWIRLKVPSKNCSGACNQ